MIVDFECQKMQKSVLSHIYVDLVIMELKQQGLLICWGYPQGRLSSWSIPPFLTARKDFWTFWAIQLLFMPKSPLCWTIYCVQSSNLFQFSLLNFEVRISMFHIYLILVLHRYFVLFLIIPFQSGCGPTISHRYLWVAVVMLLFIGPSLQSIGWQN